MDYELPIIDLDLFTKDPSSSQARKQADECVSALITYGALIVKDSRVSEIANERFLDAMEDYFAQPPEKLMVDTRPQYHYQVGVTLENTEKPKCHSDESCKAIIASLEASQRPLDLEGGHADPKCRFFHRMGRSPAETEFASLAMENVTPEAFADTWQSIMEDWGSQMQTSVQDVAEMLGVGLGVSKDFITEAGAYGPHLLAPTATNLDKYGQVGQIFAGFHTDLNFLTIHGRSRYPGLHIWARNSGKRISVKLPSGHLLVQAGKQLEHLTAGLILAGYHEVVCTQATVSAIKTRQANISTACRPSIRISSTYFWHLSSDFELRPDDFSQKINLSPAVQAKTKVDEQNLQKHNQLYPVLKVGTLVQNELRHISLMA